MIDVAEIFATRTDDPDIGTRVIALQHIREFAPRHLFGVVNPGRAIGSKAGLAQRGDGRLGRWSSIAARHPGKPSGLLSHVGSLGPRLTSDRSNGPNGLTTETQNLAVGPVSVAPRSRPRLLGSKAFHPGNEPHDNVMKLRRLRSEHAARTHPSQATRVHCQRSAGPPGRGV